MHEFFSTRARSELKAKYNREERVNWDKLKKVSFHCAYAFCCPCDFYEFQVLSRPALLDDSLYETANQMIDEIRAEEEAKELEIKEKKDRKAMEKQARRDARELERQEKAELKQKAKRRRLDSDEDYVDVSCLHVLLR